MKTEYQNKSDFIGFLEGYKAKNIAYLKPSLLHNLEEIEYNLDLLIDSIKKLKNKDILNLLEKSKEKLKSDTSILEIAYVFGESLVNNFSIFDYANKNKGEIFILLKRIIYNFVEFAKKCEDNRIIDLAKRIAKNLAI